MGYDIRRFTSSDVAEEFICPICHDVLQEPVLIDRCEHVFCHNCIHEWMLFGVTTVAKDSTTASTCWCPIDRQVFEVRSLRPPQRSFRNLLFSLEISCDFAIDGCRQLIQLSELALHVTKCEFNPCVAIETTSHEEGSEDESDETNECESCGCQLKRRELQSHDCVSILKELVRSKSNEIERLNQKLEYIQSHCVCGALRPDRVSIGGDKRQHQTAVKQLIDSSQTSDVVDGTDSASPEDQLNSDNSEQNLEPNSNFIDFKKQISCADSIPEITQSELLTSSKNKEMVEALKGLGYIKSIRIELTMLAIDRGHYAPSAASYVLEHARSIGYGVHTGPSTFDARILELLSPYLPVGAKILDIGCGSGYLTACLAVMTGTNGVVVAIDHIPQLVKLTAAGLHRDKPGYIETNRIKLAVADGRFGYAKEAPYDLIFVGALSKRIPQKLVDQLKPDGCVIMCLGGYKSITIERVTKAANGDVCRQLLCDDWSFLKETCTDVLEDKKMQLRYGWKVKLGL